jgi:hypothetical protein
MQALSGETLRLHLRTGRAGGLLCTSRTFVGGANEDFLNLETPRLVGDWC